MSTVPTSKRYLAHVVFWVSFFLAWPMWREFHEPGHLGWNTLLGLILAGLVAGSFFGVRYLQNNRIEVGEARFSSPQRERR